MKTESEPTEQTHFMEALSRYTYGIGACQRDAEAEGFEALREFEARAQSLADAAKGLAMSVLQSDSYKTFKAETDDVLAEVARWQN